MKATDNCFAWLAEVIKTKHKDITFVTPKPLKAGDVVVTTDFTQLHCAHYDTLNGVVHLNMVFYGAGALFLVLSVEDLRVNVVCLEDSGRTGWINYDHLKLFE